METRSNIAGNIAKDADILGQTFTAKELLKKGYHDAKDWINNVEKQITNKIS